MTQLNFLPDARPAYEITPALARRSDPPTSHEAAAKMQRSGRADAHCAIVLAAVVAHPGLTYRELADLCGLDPVEVMRRLGDLQLGLTPKVVKAEARQSANGGNRMTTWRAAVSPHPHR